MERIPEIKPLRVGPHKACESGLQDALSVDSAKLVADSAKLVVHLVCTEVPQ
jgi:hypothetical protein